ncbi:MAG: glycosyltransferase [Jaaginema sp. PMC 1079.18]|nr:glycosyltransferase [Jaaginema sp. PMC 1080.18]MEC4849756.1 glycosyltransferase [Jaaginema sp. PMC 1079.18]MEC4866620.1 glycosyltransferase [Jaaginema sp. PMC 1078.18]
MSAVDVIIPVKNRPLMACVRSLLNLRQSIRKIIICDGGSTQPEILNTLATFASNSSIQVIHYPITAFNKAVLINQGIRQAQAETLLISDADIVWNPTAFIALIETIKSQPRSICHIENVVESDGKNQALARQRYHYFIQSSSIINAEKMVIIQKSKTSLKNRPGCGLVCARRETFWQLGGYKEIFQGWGWEDQDLLIRAEVLDIPILQAGQVLHLSHSDESRNQFFNHSQPQITRDINIKACVTSLQNQQLLGDLNSFAQHDTLPKVKVEIL